MDFAELIKEFELEGEDELQKSLEDAGVSEDAREGLVKAARIVASVSDEVTGDEVETVFKALGYELDTGGAVTDDGGDDDPADEPELSKSALEDQGIDSALAERIADSLEKSEEREARIEKLEGEIQDREEDEALEKWISKAEDNINHLSRDAETVGSVLRAVEKAEGTDAAQDHLDMLTGADEAVEKSGMFDELGVAGGEGTASAEDTLEKHIQQELEKADDAGEDISRYEAKTRAIRNMDEETRSEIRGRS